MYDHEKKVAINDNLVTYKMFVKTLVTEVGDGDLFVVKSIHIKNSGKSLKLKFNKFMPGTYYNNLRKNFDTSSKVLMNYEKAIVRRFGAGSHIRTILVQRLIETNKDDLFCKYFETKLLSKWPYLIYPNANPVEVNLGKVTGLKKFGTEQNLIGFVLI